MIECDTGGRGSENGHFCVTSFMNDPLAIALTHLTFNACYDDIGIKFIFEMASMPFPCNGLSFVALI